MNLYIFNESSRAAVYGIGTYIHELTAALRQSRINVCVVHLKSAKSQIHSEEKDGIANWCFPAPVQERRTIDHNKQSELYYRNIVYLFQLYIEDKENLIFHLNFVQSSKLAEELKKTFSCKVITSVHYSNWGGIIYDNLQRLRTELHEKNRDDFGKILKNSVEEEKLLYSKADHVVCLSNYMLEILCGDYDLDTEKISMIPNGLTDTTEKDTDVKFLRRKWNIPFREKIILFAGRMDKIKGLEYLLESFRTVLQSYPRCRLVIAGSGPFDKYIKEFQDICTKITYTGLLGKSPLNEWYRLADVGVIPSLFEPFGYVAVEMMMHGLPIVATATSGLNEVVDDTCGLKVPLTVHSDSVEIDTAVLSQKILYLLQNPSEARKMGENGRKKFLKEYSSEVFRRNMLNFYQSIL